MKLLAMDAHRVLSADLRSRDETVERHGEVKDDVGHCGYLVECVRLVEEARRAPRHFTATAIRILGWYSDGNIQICAGDSAPICIRARRPTYPKKTTADIPARTKVTPAETFIPATVRG